MVTFKKVNQRIRFWGMSPTQFATFALANMILIIIAMFLRVPTPVMAAVIGLVLYLSSLALKRLKAEHKEGNPDYLSGLSIKWATPRKIVDKHRVSNLIMNKE